DALVQAWQQPLLDEVKRRADVADGLGSRRRGYRDVGGPEQPLRRLVARELRLLAGRFQRGVKDSCLPVVEGEDLGQGRLTLAGDRLAPARRLRVEPRPLGARQRAVRDLLDEDVA